MLKTSVIHRVSGPGGAREAILAKMMKIYEIHQISLNLTKFYHFHGKYYIFTSFAKPTVAVTEY